VAAANDYGASGERVSVVAELTALKLKFDAHTLPAFRSDLSLGLAIGESGLNRFDHVAEFFRDHAE
jgi:hypothetical protein